MRVRFADPIREAPTSTERSDPDHECPLCGRPAGTEDDVYCHLMVDHRKSTLSTALIETDTDAPDSPARRGTEEQAVTEAHPSATLPSQ